MFIGSLESIVEDAYSYVYPDNSEYCHLAEGTWKDTFIEI